MYLVHGSQSDWCRINAGEWDRERKCAPFHLSVYIIVAIKSFTHAYVPNDNIITYHMQHYHHHRGNESKQILLVLLNTLTHRERETHSRTLNRVRCNKMGWRPSSVIFIQFSEHHLNRMSPDSIINVHHKYECEQRTDCVCANKNKTTTSTNTVCGRIYLVSDSINVMMYFIR